MTHLLNRRRATTDCSLTLFFISNRSFLSVEMHQESLLKAHTERRAS